jgi:hypothetical protein
MVTLQRLLQAAFNKNNKARIYRTSKHIFWMCIVILAAFGVGILIVTGGFKP